MKKKPKKKNKKVFGSTLGKEYLYRFIPPPGDNPKYHKLLEELITNNRISPSFPSRLNDPFDCKTIFTTKDATVEDLDLYIDTSVGKYGSPKDKLLAPIAKKKARQDPKDAIERLRFHYTRVVMNELDERRILSFSHYSSPKEPNDQIMWSHYAYGHRGFCFQFNRQVLIDNFICKKITYINNYPSLKEIAKSEGEELAKLILFRKSTRWAYENEWRVMVPYSLLKNDLLELPCDALTGVILGCESNPNDLKLIMKLNKSRDGAPLNIFLAEKHSEEYKIIIRQLI